MRSFSFLLLCSAFCLAAISSHSQPFDSYLSNEGRGLFYDADNMLPKKAMPTLLYKKEIPKAFQYGQFYRDPYTQKNYIYTYDRVMAIDNLLPVQTSSKQLSKQDEKLETISIIEDEGKGIVEAPFEGRNVYNSFIKKEQDYKGPALRMPQHHLFLPRLQALNANRKFDLDKVLDQLNKLSLVTSRHVKTKSGGFNVIYDRLFINDEDPNKFLVIWLKNDRLYANFLLNNGEWELTEPKIVHTDVILYNQGQAHKRSLDTDTDKSTLVTELSCLKSGEGYYIGYSITSWESSAYFSLNIASCHVSYLSGKLDIVRTVQLPQHLTTRDEDKIFASDFQMQLALRSDTLCAVIQSPGGGKDKLFVQCLDKNLFPIRSLRYLSNNSQTYANLVSVIPMAEGFLITYKEKRKNSTAIYSQLIDKGSYAYLPVSVYEVADADDEYISWVNAGMDKNGVLSYYLKINSRKNETAYLHCYQLSVTNYLKALRYEITKENWKQDITVREANAAADAIDKTIAKKGLAVFKKTYRESLQKIAYADSNLVIRKWMQVHKQGIYYREDSYYYDKQGSIRKINIILKAPPGSNTRVKPGSISIYYNQDGQKLWEVKENADGTTDYGEKAVESNRLLYSIKINDPFAEFHSKEQ